MPQITIGASNTVLSTYLAANLATYLAALESKVESTSPNVYDNAVRTYTLMLTNTHASNTLYVDTYTAAVTYNAITAWQSIVLEVTDLADVNLIASWASTTVDLLITKVNQK